MTNFLNAKGPALLNAGFPIIPIKEDTKMPGYSGWQNTQAHQTLLQEWLDGPFKDGAGVGVLAKTCPAIDIDVLDKTASDELVQFCLKEFNATLIRYGKRPKALLPFKLNQGVTLKKQKSAVYEDFYGDTHMVEVLADGQQWVAYHTHPETKQPYTWEGPDGEPADLADLPYDELPILDQGMIDKLMAKVKELADTYGWEVKRKAAAAAGGEGGFDDLMNAKESLGYTLEQIEKVLSALDPEKYSAYDDWLRVGMAVHHETNGSDEGKDLWDSWSMKMVDYDNHELELKWASFDLLGNGNTTTLRSLIHNANEDKFENSDRALQDLTSAIKATSSRDELVRDVPKLIRKSKDLDDLAFEDLVQLYRAHYKNVVGTLLPVGKVRAMLHVNDTDVADTETPTWAKNWCYLQNINRFYHSKTRASYTKEAFNAEFDRELTPKDKRNDPEFRLSQHASDHLIKGGLLPAYAGIMYMPGCEATFSLEDRPGLTYVNTYREKKVTAIKRKYWTNEQKDLAYRLDLILERTGSTPQECLTLRQWLAYKLMNPDKKMLWSVIAVGKPGSGKTTWAELMTLLLGLDNTRTISPKEFNGTFSDWGAGHILGLVEEIKLRGGQKYEVLNTIKPNLTNAAIAVRRMYQGAVNEPNHADFYLTSNHEDCVPIDNSDRRYFVMFSKFFCAIEVKAADRVLDAGADEGTWWRRFYELMRDSANLGVIKAWLLETDMTGFNPSRAPLSKSRDTMIALSQGSEQNFIEDLLTDDSHPVVSADLLSTNDLTRIAMEEHLVFNLNTRALNSVLQDMEFRLCGRVKIEGYQHQLWSRNSASANWANKELRALYLRQKSKVEEHDDFEK